MPLPKVNTPTYELVLPSTNKKIKYRPFLVREEKILIMALETEDVKQITSSVIEILNACILTRGIKIEKLATFDLEYLFLNVRAKSVGESIDLLVTCGDDGETEVGVTVPIADIQVVKSEEHTKDIEIGDGWTVKMKYPSLSQFIETNFTESADTVEKSFQVIASCIDIVYNKDDMFAAADCTKKELKEWVESLTSQQFQKIEKFFETMPKLTHTLKVINPKTRKENTVVLEGLTDFFA